MCSLIWFLFIFNNFECLQVDIKLVYIEFNKYVHMFLYVLHGILYHILTFNMCYVCYVGRMYLLAQKFKRHYVLCLYTYILLIFEILLIFLHSPYLSNFGHWGYKVMNIS